ncbi:hypothetical protein KP79_PYT25991 [Mizuhopecten yessoensis]|uniref:Uncharacterized protein n=1 Tax=Mizuhopecten yessoensis TaxID=6573 RepID=A0A210PK13_MIZYE|nr:hypothetical protein KP79_PYT25991 [Mizuhopecten yessoensis]
METVPNLLLKNQNELQILNTSNNERYAFDLELKHMEKLQHLNIYHNQLHTFSKYDRFQIYSLKRLDLTVNLYGNELQCSCETLDFLKWLDDNKAIFQNFRNYECRSQMTQVQHLFILKMF